MNVIIIYSTIYGHNLEMSQFIHDKILPDSTLISMDNFTPVNLANYDLIIMCPCTYGEGQLTTNEEAFYHYLTKCCLTGSDYLIVGVGDKHFGPRKFANAVSIFAEKLAAAGASSITHPLKVDYDEAKLVQKRVNKIINNYYQKKGLTLPINTTM
ncbi:flavodoxin-like domain-containing protein [Limosilactobacillus sp. STM2_1]|uniref:Flavodoxin-like domain-containing protein n=1 Tax=Limosilactobacillus rudii TaxID=2759755 RepID=A0A7W3YPC2_9LACO|nr:flavodoxin family protein [Limosilactobacillus rudii]MBB1078902.1 flavodoxin-like domain-containing protein [Limosilactobacillus rudii]MBB1098222.1 flavodoxin-like domain-containing protein [Limosilactobacillus rudii]MCD7135663.1 flavodoxin-like domain-containing protein [Limosilactobacillus rudii]